MIYKATELIKQEMDRQDMKYSVEEFDDRSIIFAGFGIDNGPSVRVQFVSQDNDNDVAIRLYGLVNSVAESKVEKMQEVVNECNCQYRYLKFTMDKDRDVNIEYDIPLRADDETVGAMACEIFIRIMKVADDAYPKFMRIIWG